MPRTWASPRPSCPMVQLIICSATRKLMLAYASLCLRNCRVSRPEPQREGGLTDCLGIGGLGLDLKMSGPLRTWVNAVAPPPPPCVSPSVQVLLWGRWPRWLCGQRPCWPTQTLTLLPLSRETKTLKGSVRVCESCMWTHVTSESKACIGVSIYPLSDLPPLILCLFREIPSTFPTIHAFCSYIFVYPRIRDSVETMHANVSLLKCSTILVYCLRAIHPNVMARIKVGHLHFCWPCIWWNISLFCSILGSPSSFMQWQCSAYNVVRLRHTDHLVRVRKRSHIGLGRHCWKSSRGLLKTIQWCEAYKCWNVMVPHNYIFSGFMTIYEKAVETFQSKSNRRAEGPTD